MFLALTICSVFGFVDVFGERAVSSELWSVDVVWRRVRCFLSFLWLYLVTFVLCHVICGSTHKSSFCFALADTVFGCGALV